MVLKRFGRQRAGRDEGALRSPRCAPAPPPLAPHAPAARAAHLPAAAAGPDVSRKKHIAPIDDEDVAFVGHGCFGGPNGANSHWGIILCGPGTVGGVRTGSHVRYMRLMRALHACQPPWQVSAGANQAAICLATLQAHGARQRFGSIPQD